VVEVSAANAGATMRTAAAGLLASLDAQQRTQASFPFESEGERRTWFCIPTDHGGLPLSDISAYHQKWVFQLLAGGLLNAKLHDNVIAAREGLPSVEERARHVRAIVDGYGLSTAERRGFMDRVNEFTVHDAADEADLAQITTDTAMDDLDARVPWALARRIRAAAWQIRQLCVFERALA
jgi:hypothetical protein